MPGLFPRRVTPFGYLRIYAFRQLPGAFRSLHVLHRLLAPRHPPCTLSSLTALILVLMRTLGLADSGESDLAIPLFHCQRASGLTAPLVEITGVEPVTSALQRQRSPN